MHGSENQPFSPLTIDAPDRLHGDEGIDLERLADYLKSRIPGLSGDLELFKFSSGHSNLTYMVKCGDSDLVLKRPPAGRRARSAHDMGREFRVLSRLHGIYPYAPRAYDYCDDESIIGSPFCVMERVSGVIVRRQHAPEVTPAQIAGQFTGLIDALADLHSIDVAAAGLSDFGRPQGYRRRQLEGWQKRLEAARTDNMADFSAVTEWLAAHVPRDPESAAIVHNDFKLDNVVWTAGDITKLKAVLDWEMSTIGDPLMDLACTISFWVQESDPAEFRALRAMPTGQPGVMGRQEAVTRYARRRGIAADSIDFYLCFGLFRRAVIEQQKYVRFRRGETDDSRFENLDRVIGVLREMCSNVMSGRMSEEDGSKHARPIKGSLPWPR
jgi:aminoglycoside phosphotransferase (APT) family kinase protein